MTFHELLQTCREELIVRNDASLRAYLAEMRDHDLVGTRRGPDGSDCLYLSLPAHLVSQLAQGGDDE